MTAPAAGDLVVLREDEPRAATLRAVGWSVVGTSWGARLTVAAKATVDWRAYAALHSDGALGAVTVMRPDDDRIETEFTVTRAVARRQGLASAVRAFGILDHVGDGHLTFGTGGHAANVASVRVNERLGYVLEPRWLTLRRP